MPKIPRTEWHRTDDAPHDARTARRIARDTRTADRTRTDLPNLERAYFAACGMGQTR